MTITSAPLPIIAPKIDSRTVNPSITDAAYTIAQSAIPTKSAPAFLPLRKLKTKKRRILNMSISTASIGLKPVKTCFADAIKRSKSNVIAESKAFIYISTAPRCLKYVLFTRNNTRSRNNYITRYPKMQHFLINCLSFQKLCHFLIISPADILTIPKFSCIICIK